MSRLAIALGVPGLALASSASDPAFEHRVLSTEFWAEGAAAGDLDGDGANDIAAGSQWWRGPGFTERRALRAGEPFDPHGYSDAFFGWTRDFDGDGGLDLLQVGFPGQAAYWLEEPGRAVEPAGEARGFRPAHLVFPTVDNESPAFADLSGDGAADLVFQAGARFGWAAPDARDPREEWRFHPITPPRENGPFVHGLGVGDVDGDGRTDLLEKNGWWRQPLAAAGADGDEVEWTLDQVDFGAARGGAQMYAVDLDGDGDADVATSLEAHGFGLAWHEQTPAGFVRHDLLGRPEDRGPLDLAVSQLHAVALADVDGDGLVDLSTGKRWWAHGPDGDPDPEAPALLLWIGFERAADGSLVPRAHQVDDDSGVGTALTVQDVDLDGAADFVVASKRGVFVHLQRRGTEASPAGSWRPRWGGSAANLDFEGGTLAGWLVEGDAFAGQPVRGDTVSARGREPSRHQGTAWIGGYELAGDAPTGRLTSQPFTVEAPWASFLVGGGAHYGTRVELLDESGAAFFAIAGVELETLQRVAVDLSARVGQSISIRLVDEESGHWGHVNFDDFRFHAARPACAPPPGVAASTPFDAREAGGLAPDAARRAMELEAGWEVALVAAEPELHQPVALAVDGRGRLWVAEAFAYPLRRDAAEALDDILVFEDRDADGSFEARTVFASGLNLVSGLEVGHGGVFVGAAPELLFIPDRDGDLVPDGNPVALLDGFGFQDTHETLNSFTWGPDGWLWGCHGVFTHSRVGRPGASDAERVPMNAAVWRFDPRTGDFEVVAAGTSNPWGLDFDTRGQAFIEACVVPHLWHVIPGARYERQAGEHFDPWVYQGLSTIADHLHWAGADQWTSNQRSGSLGGGHAHCGLLLQPLVDPPGGSRALIGNIHGNRVNADLVARSGSGYAASHGPDFLLAHDSWFRAIAVRGGLSGEVYLIDWYDRQACHTTEDAVWDRTNGRLYRIAPRGWKPGTFDVEGLAGASLAEAALGDEPALAQRARVWLAENGAPVSARVALAEALAADPDPRRRLRALWALWGSPQRGGIGVEVLAEMAREPDADLRGWAVRLLAESPSGETVAALAALAKDEPSSAVRLELASACQRIAVGGRAPIVEALAAHGEDAADQNLPLMLWYALAPLVEHDPARALAIARAGEIPLLAENAARRAAELASPTALEALLALFAAEADPERLAVLLSRATAALAVRGQIDLPPNLAQSWAPLDLALAIHPDLRVREHAAQLSATFGGERAAEALRGLARLETAELEARIRAVESIALRRDPAGPAIFLELLAEPALAAAALRALAPYAASELAEPVLARWPAFDAPARAEAVALLSARPSSARELLAAVEGGRLAPADLDAFARRQLALLADEEVDAALARIYGSARPTRAAALARATELGAALTPAVLAAADRARGRARFERTCGQCHALFGSGGTLGPELTGSNRRDLGYLLTNVLDPSAVVGSDYQAVLARTSDGRTLTGVLKRSTDSEVVLQTQTDSIRLARADVEELVPQQLSTMPEGLFDGLAEPVIAELVAYLQGEAPCAVAAELRLAPQPFDGRTLAGWSGEAAVWSVEDGAVVGRTSGLEHNSFLVSELELGDFRLEVEVLLVGDAGNSGIQFRSRPFADGANGTDGAGGVAGYQADIGPGWWGKLYEEHGRGLLVDASCTEAARPGEWNSYVIEARGAHLLTWINGARCIDLTDPDGARRGQLALQVHSGGPTEVRFRGWKLELLAPEGGK